MRMLCDLDDVPLITETEEGERFASDPENWIVQILRSIDGHSTYVNPVRRMSQGVKLKKVRDWRACYAGLLKATFLF